MCSRPGRRAPKVAAHGADTERVTLVRGMLVGVVVAVVALVGAAGARTAPAAGNGGCAIRGDWGTQRASVPFTIG